MDLSPFLLAWRTATLPDREVIDALVHPAHAEPSPELAAALRSWPGTYYWSEEPEGRHLVLTRPLGHRRREAWALHLLLVAATLFTTTFVGAVFHGAIPFDPNPLALVLGTYPFPPDFLRAWATGLLFSAPLVRSEEHTSELQSRPHLVCRLLLEKKKQKTCTHSYVVASSS